MTEVWKWVKGFEGLYQISSHGRLKSFLRNKEGYILSETNLQGDYLAIVLRDLKTKKIRHSRIHVLVAETFIGEIPVGWHVHHKDGNKQNNCVENLEIIHPKKHRQETLKVNPRIVSGMVHYNKFERPKHIIQYDMDGNFIAEYANAKIASELTGVCQRNIVQVANSEEYKPGMTRKQAGGYVWKIKEVV